MHFESHTHPQRMLILLKSTRHPNIFINARIFIRPPSCSLNLNIFTIFCSEPEVDPELDFGGHLIHFIVFSCRKFLNTVCYRKYCPWLWPSWPPRSGLVLSLKSFLNSSSTKHINCLNMKGSNSFILNVLFYHLKTKHSRRVEIKYIQNKT